MANNRQNWITIGAKMGRFRDRDPEHWVSLSLLEIGICACGWNPKPNSGGNTHQVATLGLLLRR